MAVEADSVVVTLLAENEQFDAASKASATNFQQSMSSIQTSGKAAEGAVGQFSSALKENRLAMNQSRIGMMEFQHIARGVSDQMAAGAPPVQIFTQHLGMLSEAVALSGGAFGKVGAFLGGPWGVALTLATVVGAKLITNLVSQKDSLNAAYDKLVKHKEQTELNAKAEDIWAHSIEGLIDRSEKLNTTLQKRLQTQTDLQKATLSQAQADFATAISAATRVENDPSSTPKQVADAEKAIHDTSIALHNAQVLAGQDAGEAIASITQSAKVWADEQLHALQILQTAHPEMAEKGPASEMLASFNDLKDAIDKAAAAGVNFNDTVTQTNRLNTELANGTIKVDKYDQSIRGLAQSLRDVTAASKDAVGRFKQAVIGAEGTGPNKAGSPAAGFGQFMPGTFESYFKQLYPSQAAGMTTQQIDAERNVRAVATAVLDAATKDYVTVLKAAGQQITQASLYTVHVLGAPDARKFFSASDNESVLQALGGTGHARAVVAQNGTIFTGTVGQAKAQLAQRIGGSSSAVSAGAAAIQQQIDAEAKKQAEQQAAFTAEMDRLNKDLIDARKGQTKDEIALLDIQEDEVKAEQQKRDDTYASAVSTGKLTQGQADLLTAQAATVAAEKLRALEIQKEAEVARRQHDLADQGYGFAEEALKAQEAAATSQHQRRELDLAILDVMYDQKLADLEYLKLQAERNGQLAEANKIQQQIDQLPAEKATDRAQTLRGTMDPLEAWLHSVPQDAQAVTEALQGIAVNGFDQIASSIADVVTGTETLGQAFGNIAKSIINDIVQMTIKMLIFRAISGLMGGGFDASVPSLNIGSPNLPELGPASAIDIGIPHSASGNTFVVGGFGGTDSNLLSLNGRPLSMVSRGEAVSIIPSNANVSSQGGGNSVIIVKVEPNDDRFDAYVAGVAGPLAVQAGTRGAYGGAAMARNNQARRITHQLGSRG
jgi:hypothetical protein